MSAATDYFTTASPLWTGTVGSGGFTSGSTTLPLSSTTGLTNGEVYYATVDRVDANGNKTSSLRTVYKGLLSGTNLINCSVVEGTDQNHAAGKVVEILFTAAQWNDLKTGLEVEHNADGTHKNTIVALLAGPQTFTGTKSFSTAPKHTFGTPASGDTYYGASDGTLTRLAKGSDGQVLTLASGVPSWATPSNNTDGWTADTDTWTYVSATSFKITGKDVRSRFSKGTRVKCTNNSTTFYGVVSTTPTYSTDTTVTLLGNTDYSLANSAITSPYYSYVVSPQGYPVYFAYTPTLTSGGGSLTGTTITTATKAAITGNKFELQGSITLTNVGSGTPTGALFLTYPTNVTTAGTGYVTGYGRDYATGPMIGVFEFSSKIGLNKYDNTTLWTNGNNPVFTVTALI